MKYKKDIGFATILRNKEVNNKIKNIFIKSYKINLSFFQKKPSKFIIYLCDNEEEYKKYSRPYYSINSTAVGLGERGIATRSPEFIEENKSWEAKDFQKLMNHEISHVFWYKLIHSWSPQWFVEGLACHIGNNFFLDKIKIKEIIEKHKINYKILDYKYLRRNFKKGHFPRYQIWQSFFSYLMSKYGKNSIKKFIFTFSKKPTKNNYLNCFRRVFGLDEKEIFKEYLTFLRN